MYDNSISTTLAEGHPVKTYYQEKELINSLLDELSVAKFKKRFIRIH